MKTNHGFFVGARNLRLGGPSRLFPIEMGVYLGFFLSSNTKFLDEEKYWLAFYFKIQSATCVSRREEGSQGDAELS